MSLLKFIPGETSFDRVVLLALLVAMLVCVAKSTQKPVYTSIYLEAPIETPDGVQFSWHGGDPESRYSLFRRKLGAAEWECLELDLSSAGAVFEPGFTLGDNYEYQIRLSTP